MAKIAKSKDTANYRKGKDLKVGDEVAVAWAPVAPYAPTAFSPVVSCDGKVPYMSVTNYSFTLENGKTVFAAGGEFVQGRYTD